MLAKIGIRPVIDGRQFGIRESLEVQTMELAKIAADFITKNVRHASGEPVECVIADSTIGGIAESAACREKFSKENVVATLGTALTQEQARLMSQALRKLSGTISKTGSIVIFITVVRCHFLSDCIPIAAAITPITPLRA